MLLNVLWFSLFSDGNLGTALWTRMGDQGPKWKFASVFINLASFSPPKSSTTSIQVKINLHGAYCDIDDTYTVLGCILVY